MIQERLDRLKLRTRQIIAVRQSAAQTEPLAFSLFSGSAGEGLFVDYGHI